MQRSTSIMNNPFYWMAKLIHNIVIKLKTKHGK